MDTVTIENLIQKYYKTLDNPRRRPEIAEMLDPKILMVYNGEKVQGKENVMEKLIKLFPDSNRFLTCIDQCTLSPQCCLVVVRGNIMSYAFDRFAQIFHVDTANLTFTYTLYSAYKSNSHENIAMDFSGNYLDVLVDCANSVERMPLATPQANMQTQQIEDESIVNFELAQYLRNQEKRFNTDRGNSK